MKTISLLSAPIIAMYLFSTGAQAQNAARDASTSWDYLSSTHIKPCEYWSSNREGDYVCSGYPFSEELTDHRSLERVIGQMQDEIDALKNRVNQLESQQ